MPNILNTDTLALRRYAYRSGARRMPDRREIARPFAAARAHLATQLLA
jgi:hypothetical protein